MNLLRCIAFSIGLLLFNIPAASHAAHTNLVGWGYNAYGQATPPAGLTNAMAIAVGSWHSLALRSDGTVLAWGYNVHGETNVPNNVTNVLAVAAGFYHSLALRGDGTVVGWGNNDGGATSIPAGLTNAVAISAGGYSGNGDFSVAVRSDGSVIGWGGYVFGGANARIPAGLSDVVAISAGQIHCLALKSDGSVVGWDYGVNMYGEASVPTDVTNAVAVAAGVIHSVVLRQDGTVLAWGQNDAGQTNVPSGLSNVVAIAAGGSGIDTGGYTMALKTDGTIVSWGSLTAPSTVTNAVAIAGNWRHALAITSDALPSIVRQPWSRVAYGGSMTTLSVGAVGAPPLACQWCFNGVPKVDATNALLVLTNVQPVDAGSYSVIVSSPLGTATSAIASVTVSTNPSIAIQPANQAIIAGANATLSTVAYPGPIPISYQWLFNGTNVVGATNASFTITNAQPVNSGNYSVIVENPYGSITSSNAAISVFDLASALNATNLTWTTTGQPGWVPQLNDTHDGIAAAKNGLIPRIQQSVLQTTISGPGTMMFWWKFSNPRSQDDVLSFSINGTTQESLTRTTNWQQRLFYLASGSQLLQWAYARGNTTYYSTGYVDQVTWSPGGTPPILLSAPSNQVAMMGAPVTLASSATGTPSISYRWQFNGVPIPQATNAILLLSNVKVADSGTYSVLATNAFGTTSTSAVVVVQPFAFNGTPSCLFPSTQGMHVQMDGVFATNGVVLMCSTDLVTWLPLLTNPPATGSVIMVDWVSTNVPSRFYRALEK